VMRGDELATNPQSAICDPQSLAVPDAWRNLRQVTPARIALGRAGGSLPTAELLDFQLAHARARDAVSAPFDIDALKTGIEQLGLQTICLRSAANDHLTYLQRPDLGRRLNDASRAALEALEPTPTAGEGKGRGPTSHSERSPLAGEGGMRGPEVALIVSAGLSALAAQRQVAPLLSAWLPLVKTEGWTLAPVVLVEFGRVALEDEIGALLHATAAVMLIGERPGLGSPDSLGAYLVYAPRVGRTDAERNCVSNIRPEGLPPEAAAVRIHHLVRESLRRQLSGVQLKDESLGPAALPARQVPAS
jgi:ethanolamine ammonia-lyase small subunit